MNRIVLLAALLAITPVLAGCENFDMDSLDVFGINKKKKLPGERKELFPEGVPGVTQGIPPEYLKGNQPPPETAQTPVAEPAGNAAATPDDRKAGPGSKTAAVAPAEEPKPKPKRKRKPRTVSNPASTQITVQPTAKGQSGDQQLEPWPNTPPAQPQQPASGQSTSTAPWPSSPPPGSFSR
jgi:hypothetical protein